MEQNIINPGTIHGWGIDNDPTNNPTYPMKTYTGDDHDRINWERPPLQSSAVEILKSTERPYLTAVFGTKVPPEGLSGMLRRFAYKYSENMNRRWLLLLFADRMDTLEGRISDIFHFRFPLFTNDRGWRALAKHKPGLLCWKIIQRLIVIGLIVAVIVYLVRNN